MTLVSEYLREMEAGVAEIEAGAPKAPLLGSGIYVPDYRNVDPAELLVITTTKTDIVTEDHDEFLDTHIDGRRIPVSGTFAGHSYKAGKVEFGGSQLVKNQICLNIPFVIPAGALKGKHSIFQYVFDEEKLKGSSYNAEDLKGYFQSKTQEKALPAVNDLVRRYGRKLGEHMIIEEPKYPNVVMFYADISGFKRIQRYLKTEGSGKVLERFQEKINYIESYYGARFLREEGDGVWLAKRLERHDEDISDLVVDLSGRLRSEFEELRRNSTYKVVKSSHIKISAAKVYAKGYNVGKVLEEKTKYNSPGYEVLRSLNAVADRKNDCLLVTPDISINKGKKVATKSSLVPEAFEFKL